MKSYKAASTNENKGYATHGKFVSTAKGVGQKPGKKAVVRKEKKTDYVTKRLANLSRGLFKTRQGNAMHAQPNA